MAIEFRLATAAEIPTLKQLIPLSVRALSQGYYNAAQVESALVYIFGVDSQLVADGTYYVAVIVDEITGDEMMGCEIVGCGGWSKRKTLFGGDQMKAQADDLLDPTQEPARIRAFFVHPQWARQGIGRRIIEMCEAAARAEGFGRMELAATLPGEPLYAALGYQVVKRFDVQMPDGETLPVAQMVKMLDAGAV